MTDPTLEGVYSALAEGIDTHGPEKSEMFLAKVCLLLAHELDDAPRVMKLITDAQRNMKAMRSLAD